MIKNTDKKYGIISKIFHWVSAVFIFAMFGLGYWMVELTYYSEWYRTAPHIHKSVGILIFGFIILRLLWKIINKTTKYLGKNSEILIAKIVHNLIYVLLIVIFLSGYLISTADGRGIEIFNWFVIPSIGEFFKNQESIMGSIHKYSTYFLMFLVLLHALAALKHHFIDKDDTLKKITF